MEKPHIYGRLWKSIAHLELLILSSYSCRTPAYDALLGRI